MTTTHEVLDYNQPYWVDDKGVFVGSLTECNKYAEEQQLTNFNVVELSEQDKEFYNKL